MQNVDLTNIVVALFVLYLVLKRQLTPQVIRLNLTTYLFLIVFGAASVADAFKHHQLHVTSGITWFILGSLISAILFGYLRTLSYHLWVEGGLVMRQGTWVTIVLWVIGLSIHGIADTAWHGSNATLVLYLGITLLVQRGCVWLRAKAQYPEEVAATSAAADSRHAERWERREARRERRNERRRR
ncbi:hypothetical protein [Furfurilactobacillus siliginis]|uniref:DUF1453 domain-containing protein n=1 Tax=Furfurilactobacillus siliginis TaxID=348151 RepID=A0A0R2L9H1_9LACO|nr:hypothetical protein [Furfurilactobacillus siliginis]KRN96374.1 hypothetical protein IV55_GL001337 [Furfurilactobacillus siliginis]GEK28997.1 hypothetical protein LSI01_13080 [Furfurilactobacillus siliginis]